MLKKILLLSSILTLQTTYSTNHTQQANNGTAELIATTAGFAGGTALGLTQLYRLRKNLPIVAYFTALAAFSGFCGYKTFQYGRNTLEKWRKSNK